MIGALALALPGILVALAVVSIVAAFLPRRPALSAALERLGTSAAPAAPTNAPWDVRLGQWVHAHLPDVPWLATPTKDLRIIGVAPAKFARDKALLALVGIMAPSLFGIVMGLLGYLPTAVPVALGVPLAIALWFAPDRDVRKRAQVARAEFATSVAVYLELVAAERKRGAPAAQALTTTANIGTTWVFQRIREELTRARLSGIAPWTALDALAEEIGVPELTDVAKIIRLSGEEGASVAESLRGRGRALRAQLLADEHSKANQASERMSVPLTFLAFVFVGIVLTPLVINLLG